MTISEDTTQQYYEVIYADPPWKYEQNSIDPTRQIENQYSTMELEEIKNLKIPAAKNCILYLWTTAPKLQEAFEVINAWGFTYRTHMIWDKINMGMGHWFRTNHELLMVAIKGSPHCPPPSLRIASILRERPREHSRKPDIIRTRIASWYPNNKKLEMFARQKFKGWDTFGNQVPDDTQNDVSDFI